MGWIIFAAVVLAVFLLLCCTVNVRFEYGEGIRLRISFWWFTIFDIPSSKKKKKRTGKKEPKNKSSQNPAETKIDTEASQPQESGGFSEEKPNATKPSDENSSEKKTDGKTADKDKKGKENKRSLGDIFEIVKLLFDGFGKPLKKLLKRARIYHLRLNIICGGDDAAKAAINFGRTNILVGNALGWLDTFFTLKPADDIHIDVDFFRPGTKAECSFTLKLSLLAALAFLFTGAGRSVRYYLTHPEAAQALKSM